MGKKIKLDVIDRLLLPEMLPQEGNRMTQVIIKDVLEKLEFNQEEILTVGLRTPMGSANSNGVAWGPLSPREVDFIENLPEKTDLQKELLQKTISGELKQSMEVEIDFSATEMEELKKAVRKLDEEEKVTQRNLETINKILDA